MSHTEQDRSSGCQAWTAAQAGHVAQERLRATVSTHALVVDRSAGAGAERLLMARLAYRDHRWRKWSFPGGFVDQGERLEAALCREVEEEVGLRLLNWEQVLVVPCLDLAQPHVGFVFLCDRWQGEATIRSRELLETGWFDRAAFLQAVRDDELAYPQMREQVACLGWLTPGGA